MPKSILVISYYANMPGACQAEWVDDRITAFIEKGYSIVLLSSICTFKNEHKKIKHIRIPSISPHAFKYEFEEIKRRNIQYTRSQTFFMKVYFFICNIAYKVLNFLHLRSGEGRWSWFLSSTFISLFTSIPIRNNEFIYSTGGPASPHLTGILLNKLFGVKIISELQDPLSGDDIGRNKFASFGLRIIEKFIVKHANLTLYCTKNAMLYARKKYIGYAEKIFFVYPGSISHYENNSEGTVQADQFITSKKINITYLGSLYQTRNLDSLMSSLRLIAKEDDHLEEKIEINLYGNMNPDIKKRILAFEYNMIKIHGLISREQAMNKAAMADILLLIQNTDDRSIVTIPFKTYDYMHVGKLILGLIYRNDELEDLLLSHGHLACQADSIEEIKVVLESILRNLVGLNSGIKKSQLTPKIAVDKMIELLQAHCQLPLTNKL